jgi:hypothetical protein
MAVCKASDLVDRSGPRYLNGVPVPEVGWFGGKLFRKVKKAAKSAVKGVAHAAVDIADAPRAIVVHELKKSKLGRGIVRTVNKGGKIYSAVAPVLATGASFVPGLGSGVASAISASGALAGGKNWAQAAKAAAIGALPGGAAAYQAAMLAKDVASGKNLLKSLTKNAVRYGLEQAGVPAQYRGVVVDIASGKNVSKALQAEALKAVGAEKLASAIHMTTELARTVAAPARIGAKIIGANSVSSLARTVRPAAGFGGVTRRAVSPLVRRTLHRATGRDVGALDSAGTVWVVQPGDTGSKIAKACTGNANRWPELKASNPTWKKGWTQAQIATYGFPVRNGQRLTLPASWVKTTPVAVAPPSTSPGVAVAPSVPPVSVEDTRAKSEARVALSFWAQTDGGKVGSDITYGVTVADLAGALSGTWSARDTAQAKLFEGWGAMNGYPTGASDGAWSQSLYDALSKWAVAKTAAVAANAAAPAVQSPTVSVVVPPVATPAATATVPAVAPTAAVAPAVQAVAQTLATNAQTGLAALATAVNSAVAAAPATVTAPPAIATGPAAPKAPEGPTFLQKYGAPLGSMAAGAAAYFVGPYIK